MWAFYLCLDYIPNEDGPIQYVGKFILLEKLFDLIRIGE